MLERVARRIWYGDGAPARAARAALRPLATAYGAAIAVRNSLYARGLLPSYEAAIPVLSVGNATVGGTGKTPVAAWLAGELERLGARPAVVMRGYGDDEPRVHQRLNPGIPVVVAPDRVDGVARAAAAGATIAVLDDGFQHRRLRRDVDVVLVSADEGAGPRRLLPAGPWREPPSALRRATLAVVTRKAASADAAELVVAQLHSLAPRLPVAVAHLGLGALRLATNGVDTPLSALAGRRVLAIAAVGDPRAFVRQLEAAGAATRAAVFPDHHCYSLDDAVRLAAALASDEMAVCTLKDAVKLATHWPRAAPPLWYVSQRLVVEDGRGAIDDVIGALLRERSREP